MTKDTAAPGSGPDRDDDAEEDNLDLTDLDELGVDGVVERLRGGPEDHGAEYDDAEAAGVVSRPRPARSPIVSAIVLVVGTYLLVTMFADFRYWLRSSEPTDLGTAAELVAQGRLDDGGLHDTYVKLQGTPDVQHAARLTTKANYVGYLRITEGGGALFAALPRSKEEKSYNTFEGTYQGRMTRLGSDRAFPWLEQFFGNEKLAVPVDQPLDAWLSALRATGGGGPIELDGVTVAAADNVRLVTETPEVRLQLGLRSFSATAAEQAVASLGYPWVAQAPTQTFYRFLARIPKSERAQAAETLSAQIADPDAGNDADPAHGVMVLPLRAIYLAPAGGLTLSDGVLQFAYGENTATPGYDEDAGRLVERAVEPSSPMRVPVADVAAIRYEQPIEVDPDGFIIEVGADPSSERMAGILWLVVLGLSMANLFSILLWLRRRNG